MSEKTKTSPAENYEKYFVPGLFARWTPILLKHVDPRPGESVLDVACGTGIVARNVAPVVGRQGAVTGLDVSPAMLDVARNVPKPDGADIAWQEGDATTLPDGPFDVVVCQQGIQFFPDRKRALSEMRRVAGNGGRVGVSVWRGLEYHPVYRAICESEARYFDVPVEDVAQPFSLGDAEALRDLLSSAGFDRIDVAEETHSVRFPSPDRFVGLTLLAAAAVLPEFELEDEEARSDLIRTVHEEIGDTLRQYIDGDFVSFPMHAHVAVARG